MNISIWDILHSVLKQNHRAALVLTVASEKGSPGNAGFKMAVWEDAEGNAHTYGTIGGGVMEHTVTTEALSMLCAGAPSALCKTLYHTHNPRKASRGEASGLICSGSQTVVFVLLGMEHIPLLSTLASAEYDTQPHWLRIRFAHHQCAISCTTEEPDIIDITNASPPDSLAQFAFRYRSETDWSFSERIGVLDVAYILGGGHVGLAVSRQLSWLGFHTVVIDPRIPEDTDTLRRNTFADRMLTLPMSDIRPYIPEEQHSYILLLNSSYLHDVEALVSLAGGDFGYIGLMGSRAKIARIFREAAARGAEHAWLQSIHAPLGIPINSDTPEEIAVSIAAELISMKRRCE